MLHKRRKLVVYIEPWDAKADRLKLQQVQYIRQTAQKRPKADLPDDATMIKVTFYQVLMPIGFFPWVPGALLVMRIMIHTSYSGSTYNTQEDISDASVLLNKFNTGDGQGKVWDDYCLAHLFTYWVLSNGLLGLSNIASPSATTTGGICSTSFFSSSSGTRIIYNTALSSYTSSSNPLVFVEEVLVTGHEIGHSWGSYHDPATTPSCSNVFIMNHRTSIGAVLSAKAQNCFTDLYLYSYTERINLLLAGPPSTFIIAVRIVGATMVLRTTP
ncbi:hypothetical protein EMCRGX_G023941 [Ephydatia muelleri]